MTLLQMLIQKAQGPTNNECWAWPSAFNNQGYGVVGKGRGAVLAHRMAWEARNGPVPTGLELDHLCKTKWCWNPTHLEPVTHQENSIRANAGAHNKAKTHCIKGHEYTPSNTYIYPGNGRRACKICRQAARVSYWKAIWN